MNFLIMLVKNVSFGLKRLQWYGLVKKMYGFYWLIL